MEVWAGKLSDGSYAVLLLNRASSNETVEVNWKEIGFKEEKAKLRDLWTKKDLGEFKEGYSITLDPHDSQMLKVTPVKEKGKLFTILAIVFGALLLLLIIILIIICCIKKRKKEPDTNDVEDKLVDSKRETQVEGEEANE